MSSVTIQIEDDLLARARELASARKMTVAEMLQRLLSVIAAPPWTAMSCHHSPGRPWVCCRQ